MCTTEKNESLWMTIVAEGSNGVKGKNTVLTVDISDYGSAAHLNNNLLEEIGEFKITSISSNFKGEVFIENNRVLEGVFDLIVSEELTVREWQILEAWTYIQATHINFETDKLIKGMREAFFGIFKNTEELAKRHVETVIDTSGYNELIMNNIDYAAMGDDILWRGLYDSHLVENSELHEKYYFSR
ncbi:MAG: hypothetical protein J6N72_02535 [Psychrobacter sp.]|nr:hypothetical protein [Psychrobacter sp.]